MIQHRKSLPATAVHGDNLKPYRGVNKNKIRTKANEETIAYLVQTFFFQNKEDSEVSQTQILKKSRIYENQQNIDKNRAEET